jgi:hypothetical protein
MLAEAARHSHLDARPGAGDRYAPEAVAACLRVLEQGFAFASTQT